MESEEKPTARPPLEQVQELFDQIQKGADAGAAKMYADKFIWLKIWSTVTQLSNCPPDLNTLLNLRAELRATMILAQEMGLDTTNAENAATRLKLMYSQRQARERTL